MMARIITLLLLLCICDGADAQDVLRLSNTSQAKIVMKYLPRSQRPGRMKEVAIPADGATVSVRLTGDDPYDVSFALATEAGKPNFQAKVGPADGVPLRKLARTGQVFQVELTLAAKEQGSRTLHQVMSGRLIDPISENSTLVITDPGDASEFVDDIIGRTWNTTFIASNGEMNRATVDFDDLTFRTPQFTGRFEDLVIFEDMDGCQIIGRWSALNSRGDVFFKVAKREPGQMTGEYTFDGSDVRRKWSGQGR